MNSVTRVEVVGENGTFLDSHIAKRGTTIHDVGNAYTNDRERCSVALEEDGTAYVTVIKRTAPEVLNPIYSDQNLVVKAVECREPADSNGRACNACKCCCEPPRRGVADGLLLAASCAALTFGYFVLIPVCEALLHLSLILNRIGL